MKKLLSVEKPRIGTDTAILLARVVVSMLMLSHGIPKLASLMEGNVQFPGLFGLTPEFSLALTAFAEVFCSILILLGIGTRVATIPLIIVMTIVVFYVHAADGLPKQELPALYLLVYVILFFTGSGRYSIDYLFQEKWLKPLRTAITEDPTTSIYR